LATGNAVGVVSTTAGRHVAFASIARAPKETWLPGPYAALQGLTDETRV
jgi:hypothetical protein